MNYMFSSPNRAFLWKISPFCDRFVIVNTTIRVRLRPINSAKFVIRTNLMSAKLVAFSAIVASAAAFAPGASFQPRLRATGASSVSMRMDKSGKAPVITVFDHRGCQRGGPDKEYKGKKANGPDDEMCIKVQSAKIAVSATTADSVLQQTISVLYRK